MTAPLFTVLVAFREDERGGRGALWDFVRERIASRLPEAEVIVGGNGDRPFNKCKAINYAATKATTDWFMITDADSWVSEDQVRAGVERIQAGAGWVKPWNVKVKLNKPATEQILAAGLDWDGTLTRMQRSRPEYQTSWWSAPPLILPRSSFNRCNGLDERFGGWGQEDDAFGFALKAFFGKAKIVPGLCVHLWHPRHGRSGYDAWDGQELGGNPKRGKMYRDAHRDPAAMDELIRENRV